MQDIAGEVRTNSLVMFSFGQLNVDMQVLANQLELIYNSSLQTEDIV